MEISFSTSGHLCSTLNGKEIGVRKALSGLRKSKMLWDQYSFRIKMKEMALSG
jgi:hypothetical protein